LSILLFPLPFLFFLRFLEGLQLIHLSTYPGGSNDLYWVCDLEVIGVPSRLRLISKAVALARIDETRDLSIEEKTARRKWKNAPIFDCADWTPEAGKKRSVSRLSHIPLQEIPRKLKFIFSGCDRVSHGQSVIVTTHGRQITVLTLTGRNIVSDRKLGETLDSQLVNKLESPTYGDPLKKEKWGKVIITKIEETRGIGCYCLRCIPVTVLVPSQIQQVLHINWRVYTLSIRQCGRGDGGVHDTDQVDRIWRYTTGHLDNEVVEFAWKRVLAVGPSETCPDTTTGHWLSIESPFL
jgi:antitoxin (DNA-binding transcriptional repressor) of toxin-antitoxin stability system